MSLEQLAQIKVVSVSSRPEPAWRAPSAVFVLTGDDAVRTGAVTVPDALRAVPGLNVSQINGSTWGVGARGFQSQFATKLLVMVDGRSVYTPVFGGVFWDVQDSALADLDRIEVVLGPGGSVWGANAVNGVINIITRPAQDTLGDRVTLAAGEHSSLAELRHGWQLNPKTAGRVYAKFTADDGGRLLSGGAAADGARMARAGFRFDHEESITRHWTFSGETYRGTNDQTVALPTLAAPPTYQRISTAGERVQGGNLLARWQAPTGGDGTLRLGASLDTDVRHGAIFNFSSSNAQADLQHSLTLGSRHALDWGCSVRTTAIDLSDRWVAFTRHRYRFDLASVYAQDRITLQPDRLELTAGFKLEHNDFTGLEPQPSVRLAWFPDLRHTLWVGWSHAVRTPSLTEDSGTTDGPVLPPGVADRFLPVAIRGLGNPALRAETLEAFEAGWRWAPHPQWNVSASGFVNRYAHLIDVTSAPPFVQAAPVPALIFPAPVGNGMAAQVTGGELAVTWQPRAAWRFNLALAQKQLTAHPSGPDPFNLAGSLRGNIPRWTALASSTVQLAPAWELTTCLRWVDELPAMHIPSYTEASGYLAWRPHPSWEFALVGRNLLAARHAEGLPTLAGAATEITRRFELRITWSK
jgi:iron complex outermembrane receptor protein